MKTMIGREADIKIVDLLLDVIGELLYAIDPSLIETDRHEELKLLCNTGLDIDYTAPIDLIGFVNEIRERVDNFLMEDEKYDTDYR